MYFSDKDLLTAIYDKKDEKAFKTFYDRYAKLLLNWTAKRTGNRDVAADIVQNFWVIFWSKPYAIRTDEKGVARKYLIHYFSYRMFDYLRSSAAKSIGDSLLLETISQSEGYSHIIEDIQADEILDLIERTLQDFPEITREVFKKIWENDLSVKEISQQLGVSEKVVRTHYKKVMEVIQNRVKTLAESETKTTGTMLEIIVLLGLLQ
ncbi:RNA polymerase sigma factor [Flavobacterium sp. U410]